MHVSRRRFNRIVFSGANGFPGMVYRPFLDKVAEGLEIDEVEIVDTYPILTEAFANGEQNWTEAVKYMRSTLGQGGGGAGTGTEKTLMIGHSLGACVMTAAIRGDASAQGACLIDPPIFGPISRLGIELSMRMKYGFLYDIVGSIERRKDVWDTREEAMEDLKKTRIFRGFPKETLHSFQEFGLKEEGGKVTLVVPKETEAKTFATTPTELPRFPWLAPDPKHIGLYAGDFLFQKRRPSMNLSSGLILYSRKEEFAKERDYKFSREIFYNMHVQLVENHFVPLTDPSGTAFHIVNAFG